MDSFLDSLLGQMVRTVSLFCPQETRSPHLHPSMLMAFSERTAAKFVPFGLIAQTSCGIAPTASSFQAAFHVCIDARRVTFHPCSLLEGP
jgi:hypothetical protein